MTSNKCKKVEEKNTQSFVKIDCNLRKGKAREFRGDS